MTPGDRVKISDLRAGDVFKWKGKLFQKDAFKEPLKAWNFDKRHYQAMFDTEITYLGPLTAEMVREILKNNLPASDHKP